MKTINFTEAKPLISFFEENKERIIGNTLKHLYTDYWISYENKSMSDLPIILELERFYVVIEYYLTSDLDISIGSIDEVYNNEETESVINRRNEILNYFTFHDSVKREDVEGRKIVNITIEQFSHSFESSINGDIRPDGGDYFSTIKVHLDNRLNLCFCGADADCDGYVISWCETE